MDEEQVIVVGYGLSLASCEYGVGEGSVKVLDGGVSDGISFSVSLTGGHVTDEGPSGLYWIVIIQVDTIGWETENLIETLEGVAIPCTEQLKSDSPVEMKG